MRARGAARRTPWRRRRYSTRFAQPGAPTWALALAARCRALLAETTRTRVPRGRCGCTPDGDRPFDRARTELLFGEHLVRGSAGAGPGREQLRAALETFEQPRRRPRGPIAPAPALRGERRDGRTRRCRSLLAAQRRRSCRSSGSSPKGTRTGRSPRGCSSRRGRSTRSCAQSSPRSGSRRASSSRSSTSRRRSPATCCGRGSRARGSRSCSASCGRCAVQLCRRPWRGRSAIRRWSSLIVSRTATCVRRRRRPPRWSCRAAAATARSRPSSATVTRSPCSIYDAALDDDPELVEAVCAAATIALENEHLHRESQARLAELQAVAPANRRGGRRRAATTRAQPARRRTAAAGRARAPATTDPDAASAATRRRRRR